MEINILSTFITDNLTKFCLRYSGWWTSLNMYSVLMFYLGRKTNRIRNQLEKKEFQITIYKIWFNLLWYEIIIRRWKLPEINNVILILWILQPKLSVSTTEFWNNKIRYHSLAFLDYCSVQFKMNLTTSGFVDFMVLMRRWFHFDIIIKYLTGFGIQRFAIEWLIKVTLACRKRKRPIITLKTSLGYDQKWEILFFPSNLECNLA